MSLELDITELANRVEDAWPGGYPLHLITSDGASLCFQCVRDNLASIIGSIRTGSSDGWRVVACAVNWEDADLLCDHCGELIESAHTYGE